MDLYNSMLMNKQTWLAPEVVPSSTISGRTVEPLYNTLPARAKHEDQKVGFAIKSTHRFADDSPYTFVGFDFSAQELSVAAMFAESYNHSCNGTDKFNKAVLVGNKDEGTDFHSITAQEAGIKRSIAKNLNYALAYGSGLKTATNTIMQGLDDSEKSNAKEYAKAGINAFKGKKQGINYDGGIASNYFNYVYNKSDSCHPTLDLFGQVIPKCLDYAYIFKSGSPSQLNYFIQSVCSTNGMLSAFLVYCNNEIHELGIQDKCRFAVSIHDEIHFICHEDYTELLAKAIVRAHCATWALLNHNLNIPDLPVQRLIYDLKIDVTKCLRKEHDQVLNTPDFKYNTPGYYYYVDKTTGKLTKSS